MRKMKDSGVAWIDEIPVEWNMAKFKSMFSFGRGLPITKENLTDSGIPVISYGQIHSKENNGIHISPNLIRYVSSDYLSSNQQSLVKYGDIIFADTSEDYNGIGNNIFIDYEGKIFSGYHTIIVRTNNRCNFFAYLFNTDNWRSQLRAAATGIKVFSITQKMLRETEVIVPSQDEQRIISSYLDAKCSCIDFTIANIRTLIEKLKEYKQSVITQAVTKGLNPDAPMKDSGVPWIGKIPENIKLSRVGLHYDLILGKMICSSKPDNSYTLEPYYCAINVHFNGISKNELKEMWFNDAEKKQYKVNNGDLLIVEGGAGAGGAAIAKDINEDIYIQNSIIIARDNNSNDNRYLLYLIEFLVISGYIDFICNKATIPHFTKEKIANIPYPVFSEDERISISDYLDKKCAQIDSQIAEQETLLTKLESYKKSLIYECVTGKREVPTA